MIQRVHPLTGEMLGGKPANRIEPLQAAAQASVFTASRRKTESDRRARMTYDAARSGNDLDGHWAFADGLDADSANNPAVRHALMRRSRYEAGSNGYYAGILQTHANMLIGSGPSLRMTTGNRDFNQLVEREWSKWATEVQLRRKLWCMAHAKTQDGEAFAVLITNPLLKNGVQLDLRLIEAEQCQTPMIPFAQAGRLDGIWLDGVGNVVAYDILPVHPGSSNQYSVTFDPIVVSSANVLHWFRMTRPGGHRGIPALTSTMNVGATSRRHREATVAAAESAADIAGMITSTLPASSDSEPDPVAPFSAIEFTKRMMMVAPMGWDVRQMKGEHPNAEYDKFHRLQISELGRPISMPYNLAACDSSTYSFASGKLDTLSYWSAVDAERFDCDDQCMDRIFAAWFAEWTIVAARRDIPPSHQWDWPVHPVIDAVAEATATDIRLRNGSTTLRQVYSDAGEDLEDQLAIMAEDYFGEANDSTIAQMRDVLLKTHYPAAAPQQQQPQQQSPADQQAAAMSQRLQRLEARLSHLESEAVH